MRSNYKQLGQFIDQVKVRNSGAACQDLRGVSIDKEFMPSVANVTDTDLSIYKLVTRDQFAFNPMHVGRDEVLPIAHYTEEDPIIVSPAYVVFEISKPDELLPEYLMMWCRRPEFDRLAWFTTDSSVRGGFAWEDFYNMELPVPSPEKQREIVAEYRTVVNRIRLNERLNEKLEQTALAVYRHWFVDFEFPMTADQARVLGKPELVGQPYKASGGEMVHNEKLDQEIPLGWGAKRLGALADISAGGDKPEIFSPTKSPSCQIPIYSNATTADGLFGFTSDAKINDQSVTVSARGGIGFTSLRLEPFVPIVRLIVVIPKVRDTLNFLYRFLRRYTYDDVASAQAQLTVPDISSFLILAPQDELVKIYQSLDTAIVAMEKGLKKHTEKLKELEGLLLSRLATLN